MNAAIEVQIEHTMLAACGADQHSAQPCLQAVAGHLAAGGGRVRARICFHAATSVGLAAPQAAQLAAACELLHNASLVQDDLLDRSAMRRGTPTVWRAYGDATAVCAGDVMLSAAYATLALACPAHVLASAVALVHERTREVILGQGAEALPMADSADIQDIEDILHWYAGVARGKSASLLGLSLELPLLLAGRQHSQPVAYAAACDFAIAYQICDDLNDIEQDTSEGSVNLVLLLMRHQGMSLAEASEAAAGIATVRLQRACEQAAHLPGNCAAVLVEHAGKLAATIADMQPALARANG